MEKSEPPSENDNHHHAQYHHQHRHSSVSLSSHGHGHRHRSISNHETSEATVKDHSPFNARADAQTLYESMKGLGTEERKIIQLLSTRSSRQRQDISDAYKELYGKEIIKAFKGELKIIISGHFEDLLVALFKPQDISDAELIHQAITGLSTDADALIDIVCSRTTAELLAIKSAYLIHYGKDVATDIEGHVHSSIPFKKLIYAILAGNRDEEGEVNFQQAKWDARAMYDAGPKHWAKDDAFIPIFAERSHSHLKVVVTEFEELAECELSRVVSKDLHGDMGHLLEGLTKFAKNKSAYFAELLYKSMSGLATNHKVLIRTVVARCEKDLRSIKVQFELMYHKTFASMITGDTSGSYRNLLLALAGCHEELHKHDPSHVYKHAVELKESAI